MIQPHWEIRDMVHYYKCRFLISNIERRDRDKSPHGCYRNRGRYKRYRKHLKRYSKHLETHSAFVFFKEEIGWGREFLMRISREYTKN